MSDKPSAYQRFLNSMKIGYDEWRAGTGYDLAALRDCSVEERGRIETLLLQRGVKDWRDLEALDALDTDNADAEIRATLKSKDPALRLCAAQLFKDEPGCEAELEAAIVNILDQGQPFHTLMEGFDAAANLPTPSVKDALFRLALHGEGAAAIRAAALLFFLHGQTVAHFAMGHRALFDRFGTDNKGERRKAFQDLCDRLGVSASKYR